MILNIISLINLIKSILKQVHLACIFLIILNIFEFIFHFIFIKWIQGNLLNFYFLILITFSLYFLSFMKSHHFYQQFFQFHFFRIQV